MDFKMTGKDGCLQGSSYCSNCHNFLENCQWVSKIPVENECYRSIDDILVWDAIAFIYGIPPGAFQDISTQYSKNILQSNLGDCPEEGRVSICNSCATLLSENYKAHKLFQMATHPSSFVDQVKKYRKKGELLSKTTIITAENYKPELNYVIPDPLGDVIGITSQEPQTEENSLLDDFNFEDDIETHYENDEKYGVDQESEKDSHSLPKQTSTLPLRHSRRLKNVVVKLENLSAEKLKQKYGIKISNKNRRNSRKSLAKSNENGMDFQYNSKPALQENRTSVEVTEDIPRQKGIRKTDIKNWKCEFCGKIFRDYRHYKWKHLPKHTKGADLKSWKCEYCGKIFRDYRHYKWKHLPKHIKGADSKIWTCEFCGKVFQDYQHYKWKHLPQHTKGPDSKIWTCELCGKILKSNKSYKYHKILHGDEEEREKLKTPCTICGKPIVHGQMKIHVKKLHSGSRAPLKCPHCDKVYLDKHNYDAHVLTHSENFTPYLCGHCGNSYDTKSALLGHERIHTRKEKSVPCDLCSLMFYRKTDMENHKEYVHSTERKFVCEECGKSFKAIKNLKEHLRSHEQVKEGQVPKCDICEKVFTHSLSLQQHKRRFHEPNSKRKVHKCSFCGKVLSSLQNLRHHENVHQGITDHLQPRKRLKRKINPQ